MAILCFHTLVLGEECLLCKKCTANITLQLIRETKVHITIYTDGSATGGTTADGATIEVTAGDPADPVIIHMSKARGAELTSFYEEKAPSLLASG